MDRMTKTPPRLIRRAKEVDHVLRVPPSKSFTNRALVAAALAKGRSTLQAPSKSQDTNYLAGALSSLGVTMSALGGETVVTGADGALAAPRKPLFVGNAGTTFRFLTAIAALASGTTTITGDSQMVKRPIGDLLAALGAAGVRTSSNGGFPPVTVEGGSFAGGSLTIAADKSSQYLSALLLAAPYARQSVEIRVEGPLSSRPYVEMTLAVMRAFGAEAESAPGGCYRVGNARRYAARTYAVEPDASSASYFLAAAAVTGGKVVVPGLSGASLQGDVHFLELLAAMGCTAVAHPDALELRGGALRGIEADMNAMPDCVPTLAVVALFADGPTTIRNIAHLRFKETDRLTAIAAELTKLGASVELLDDGLVIRPGALRGAEIETYHDHRIAMSFAVAGLVLPGVTIAHPGCVAKSFPRFWDEFTTLETIDSRE
ncbi:MAG TPA: 3-phosphoshikimate 1-carboxyvinyltransferase [Thermoanaerobaculia bacterium]|nr:3-phosphoshikimate 1-carboxyvinyltransferase [Thermoanaerobaculia bacterium]